MNHKVFFVILFSLIVLAGCTRHHVIPEHLENQVSTNLSFNQIQKAPETFRGKMVVVGGKILAVDQLNHITRLEVLQLPLSENHLPLNSPHTGHGRFIALCSGSEPLDPEIVRPDTIVTIVGEVINNTTVTSGLKEKKIPVFDIKDLTIWDKDGHEGPTVEARGWYYSSVYIPYGYHSYQWSNCQTST